MTACPFCAIVSGEADADVIKEWPETLAIVPLNPVTPGHWLILPTRHVADATTDPAITATTMHRAAQLAADIGDPCNIITSVGAPATQTVFHLHIVPREHGDGLPLPWTPQQEARKAGLL